MKNIICAAVVLSLAPAFSSAASIDTCDGKSKLNIVAIKDTDVEHVEKAMAGKRCAIPGPHSGVWVFEGQRNAMHVGVMPFGQEKEPHMVVQSPIYTAVPVHVSFAPIKASHSSPAKPSDAKDVGDESEYETAAEILRALVSK